MGEMSQDLILLMAGEAYLRRTIDNIYIEWLGLSPKRVDWLPFAKARNAPFVIFADLSNPLRTAQRLEAFALTPGEWRTMLNRVLFIGFGFFERLGVLVHQAHPFDLLLEETEGAATA